MSIHSILGAGGTIASHLTPVLINNSQTVRLVSRQPSPVKGATSIAADITDYKQALKAVEGSDIVYLTVGLPYRLHLWEEKWPVIMANVIDACKVSGSKLIFFDNVYMYGKVNGVMTEETPYNPCSKKGEIRAMIANRLMDETRKGNLQGLIARAADFYGPGSGKTSMANLLVFDPLRQGKKARWLVDAEQPHSLTYTPDAAKALLMLAQSETAFGQIWHLPTAPDPFTGRQIVQVAAAALNKPAAFSILPKWMIRMAGIFNADIKESYEMLYQNEFPYRVDSSKFNRAFNFVPTSYEEGIKRTMTYPGSE